MFDVALVMSGSREEFVHNSGCLQARRSFLIHQFYPIVPKYDSTIGYRDAHFRGAEHAARALGEEAVEALEA